MDDIVLPSVTRRLLTKAEAAAYCRVGVATFDQVCPVQPVALGSRKRLIRFDVRDLDDWLDRLKVDGPSSSQGWLDRMRRDRRPR